MLVPSLSLPPKSKQAACQAVNACGRVRASGQFFLSLLICLSVILICILLDTTVAVVVAILTTNAIVVVGILDWHK